MLLTGRGGEGVVLASQLLADTFARAGYGCRASRSSRPSGAARRSPPSSAGTARSRSGGATRCASATCSWRSPPRRRRRSPLRSCGPAAFFSSTGRRASRTAATTASRASRGRGSRAATGSCRRKGGRWETSPCSARPCGCCSRTVAAASRTRSAPAWAAAGGAQHPRRARGLPRAARASTPSPPTLRTSRRRAAARPPLPLYSASVTDTRINHTGSWSLERPVLLEACNVCGLCALFCPEGAMRREDGTMEIDYLYCKGCGICEDVCPVKNAIAMEEVPA